MAELSVPYFIAQAAEPAGAPGVVVVHEANGVTAQLIRLCQRLAGEGYVVVAPDLYFRAGGSEAAPYPELVAGLDRELVAGDLRVVMDVLRRAGARTIGITGFCMGGRISYEAAISDLGFDAAVGFYGSGIAAELAETNCPTLLLFGGHDVWIPEAEIAAIVAHHPETVVYPQAGHGFMRDGSGDYVETAATDAWHRLLEVFSTHLRGGLAYSEFGASPEKEVLHLASFDCARQSSRAHRGGVDHHQIARLQERRQVGELEIGKRAAWLQMEHARRIPCCQGVLGDLARRKLVIELLGGGWHPRGDGSRDGGCRRWRHRHRY